MLKRQMFFILSAVLLITALFASTTLAGQSVLERDREESPPIEPGVLYEDEATAQATDIALLAEGADLPPEDVARAVTFQEAFMAYAEGLLTQMPDQIATIWMEPVPSTKGHIQFVGQVPAEALAALAGHAPLSADTVRLTGEGQMTMSDQIRRAELAAQAVLDLGYHNAITFFDPTTQLIRIELQLPEGEPEPRPADLVSALQGQVDTDRDERGEPRLQGRAAVVETADLELTLLRGSEPLIELLYARGGNWLRDDGFQECTSGWSVIGPHGYGIITAAHCTGLNQFEPAFMPPYGMTFRSEVFGSLGDVEYHTMNYPVFGQFYASATSIRDALYYRHTYAMVGGSVCVYGRASNVRNCNHTVEAVGVTAVFNGYFVIGNLARTDNLTSIPGDSGGGWSWNNTAWGTLTGGGNGHSYFMPIQEAQSLLGVLVIGP